jgi:hypothetical protein
LRINLPREYVGVQAGVCAHPPVRLHDFRGISGGREDLCDQRVRIECDGCDELVELFGGALDYDWFAFL